MIENKSASGAATLAEMPELISPRQAAQVCGVSLRHISRLCQRGEIPAVKLGNVWRINRDALAEKCGL